MQNQLNTYNRKRKQELENLKRDSDGSKKSKYSNDSFVQVNYVKSPDYPDVWDICQGNVCSQRFIMVKKKWKIQVDDIFFQALLRQITKQKNSRNKIHVPDIRYTTATREAH